MTTQADYMCPWLVSMGYTYYVSAEEIVTGDQVTIGSPVTTGVGNTSNIVLRLRDEFGVSHASVNLPAGQEADLYIDDMTFAITAENLGTEALSVEIEGEPFVVLPGQTLTKSSCEGLDGDVADTGCPYASNATVYLHTVNIGGKGSIKAPVEGAQVKVFDRDHPGFGEVAEIKNPSGELYGVIFEEAGGLLGSCTTNSLGECNVGETHAGDYLVIVKYVDELGKRVYVGKQESAQDFDDGLSEKDFQIMKVYKKGVFQGYRGGSKMVVEGSYLEIIAPDSAIWEGTSSVYPFIFISDSEWAVDLCAEVPNGYDIVGVYDESGDIVSSTDCIQSFISGETKVAAFEVLETGSPEPGLTGTLKIKGPKGKNVTKQIKVKDIRKNTFNAKMAQAKQKKNAQKGQKAPNKPKNPSRSNSHAQAVVEIPSGGVIETMADFFDRMWNIIF